MRSVVYLNLLSNVFLVRFVLNNIFPLLFIFRYMYLHSEITTYIGYFLEMEKHGFP